MKLLLDESIPKRLASLFPEEFEIQTVPQMGWGGTSNGALLHLAADHSFDAMITADQGIEHQQNLAELPLTVVIMVAHRTRLQDLQPLVPGVVDVLRRKLEIGVDRVAV